MNEMPTTPAAVSTTWLTAALRQWGSAATVESFTTTPLGEGQGFFGQLVRLINVYAKGSDAVATNAPQTLIAKFSSPMPEMRARSVDSYAREVRFYQHLAPTTRPPSAISRRSACPQVSICSCCKTLPPCAVVRAWTAVQ